ncbi:MAG: BamA/TamA family outer membrane protein [Chitinophagaceae bacterium]|nr:BamA/TamA family outer membrane protein [Chitinophagaceae bacterium]
MRLTVHKIFTLFGIVFPLLVMMSSCSLFKTHVSNYPVSKPFVYDNRIELNGSMSKDEKKRLTEELDNYWDDSLKVRKLQKFGVFYSLPNPPVFDTANLSRSISFMNAYLNSQGYYYATFKDSIRIDTFKNQLRANIVMYIDAGKNISIDSVAFDMGDANLQRLTDSSKASSLLQTGKPYSKQLIDAELDRLVGIYRQNGYYYFTRDDIYALVDSIDASLLTLTLDPFKQAQLIAEAARNRRIDPKWDVTIMRKPVLDSAKLTPFHIGKSYYYPEAALSDIPDSLVYQRGFLETRRNDLVMRYRKGLFHLQPLREHTYLRNGALYNESNYYKTINTLSQLGAWQQVDGVPRKRDRDTLDMYYVLVPAVKQSYTLALEGSRVDVGLGNLWGISGNIDYTNRNVWKRAIQSLTTFRAGVELNILTSNQDPLVQTFLINLGHTYAFPRLIQPFKRWKGLNNLDNKRTLFSINGSYVDRRDYYQLRSLVTSWGYEWKKGNNTWLYKPINVELYSLERLPKLDTLIKQNPFLKTSFNEGRVISQSLSFIKNFNSAGNFNKTHYIRLGVEEAGGLFGLIPGLKNNIYRYIKLEGEYIKRIKMDKTDLAWRAFGGFGYNYSSDPAIGQTLPFFKQFSVGGPYSMRAWGLRQLGLGSSTLAEKDPDSTTYRDRFGDMRLEANVEYRFPLTTIAGIKISSALYADAGNIWNLKPNTDDPKAQFVFANLLRDLAIGVGTGVRVDFSYFLIRLDVAYKLKDPARPYNNGWTDGFHFYETRPNGLKVSNYAFQLGIGLPF